MTNQTDIDALVADLRGLADLLTGLANRATLRKAADTLEATAAELRQERERADEAERNRDEFRTAWNVCGFEIIRREDELARAQEVIESVEDFVARHYLDMSMGKAVLDILATYKPTTENGSER